MQPQHPRDSGRERVSSSCLPHGGAHGLLMRRAASRHMPTWPMTPPSPSGLCTGGAASSHPAPLPPSQRLAWPVA